MSGLASTQRLQLTIFVSTISKEHYQEFWAAFFLSPTAALNIKFECFVNRIINAGTIFWIETFYTLQRVGIITDHEWSLGIPS